MSTCLDLHKIHDGLARSLYRGVAIQKFPFDYLIYQMIIEEIRPDLIIEIGTMHGGSALYFADLMELVGIEGGEVHSIDLLSPPERKEYEDSLENHVPHPQERKDFVEFVTSNPRIKFFNNGYKNYSLNNCKGFKRILVIDDGSHVYEQVLESMEKFKDIVSVGSYFIIEDGNAMEVCKNNELLKAYEGGPLRAIYKFLAENDNYRVDYRWCDMYGINSTFNTYGYLRKIK